MPLALRELAKRIVGESGKAVIRRWRVLLYEYRHAPAIRYQWMTMKPRRPVEAQTTPSAGVSAGSASRRTKKHVLFVTEKWCDNNPECGVTHAIHNLFGSLETSGLGTQDKFHLDEYHVQTGRSGDVALLQQCLDTKPDLMFLTWLPFGGFNPKFETLRIIRNMGVPIVALWWDSVNPSIMEMAEGITPLVNVNILTDSASAYLTSTRTHDKFMPIFPPQDTRVFCDPGWTRDIGISFVGSIGNNNNIRGFADRRSALDALRAAGLEVFHSGGQRESPLSLEEYARTFKRSRIGLNFSKAGAGGEFTHMKLRVLETTLCGALLLEADNQETSRWFTPMVDYVPFFNQSDLVDKARYYLEHEDERRAIASQGNRTAMERYNSERFWATLFARVFGPDSPR